MKQIFDQFLQFLQQGIAAIFRFVQLVWTWSIDQITKVTHVPWENWPLWKQILLVLVIGAVGYALFLAVKQLWVAGVHVMSAFASFLGALVLTLPMILIAGLTALAGLWVINHINLSSLPAFTLFERSTTGSSNDSNRQSDQPTQQGGRETTGRGP